ncbi:MAG: hypothetical protein JO019_04550 [Candidatus Kaiserbacteria bacterium]|nr:hypothetical protein [Candidatus Kaiserbacteria bacterium]
MADDEKTGAGPDTNETPREGIQGTPPASGGVPSPSDAAAQPDLQSDIAKILEGVKLPERRGAESPAPEAKKYDTAFGEETEHIARPETPPAPAASDDEHVAAVHTLKQDLQGIVRDQKISLVRAAALEQERPRPEPIEAPVPKKRSGHGLVIILSALVLLFLGGSAIAGVYFISQQSAQTNRPVASSSIVFAETTQPFELTAQPPQAIRQSLAQMRNSVGSTLGSITRIDPVIPSANPTPGVPEQEASLRQFLTAIGASPPEELLRALSDQFFLGIHTVDKNAPVLVIPVTSYDHAFKAMLDWEPTMNADLAPLFTPVPSLTTGADGIPTTRQFSDLVMRNYDVRALKDDAGDVELYYSFPTRDILIIAESPYSFPEVLSRLQAQRRL